MGKQEQQNPTALEAQEKVVKAPELTPDEIKERLDRYDGFDELLAPLADNLDRFSPGSPGKKRRFLQDGDLMEDRKELKNRLQSYVDFLSQTNIANHKEIRSSAQEKLDSNEDLINENLSNILREARDLERTYRELELYFRNAAPGKVKNLTLINVHPDVLLDDDSNSLYNVIEKRITDESRSVDQKKAYSLLVIPNLWRGKQPKKLIERYTKLAGAARISFLTDFADCDSVEETLKEREAKRWQGVTGPEAHHSKLILFANHLVLRGKYPGLKEEEEELHGSPAIAVAGKMHAERISQPIMGEMNGSISDSQGLAFRTVQDEVADLGGVGLNALTHAFEKDMVYECVSAFTGAEYGLKRYAVVRCFDYVNRVVRHYLGRVTGQALDWDKSDKARRNIQDFLNELKEKKIITAGEVKDFEWDSKIPDRINFRIEIRPLWAVRTFVYALEAKEGKETSSEYEGTKAS